jgi:hypothetical protein
MTALWIHPPTAKPKTKQQQQDFICGNSNASIPSQF